MEIGYMKAIKKKTEKGITNYNIESRNEFKVFTTFSYDSELDVNYINGSYLQSVSTAHLNKKLRDSSYVMFNSKQQKYEGTYNQKRQCIASPGIRYSVAHMYFDEPEDKDSIFSETYLEYCPLIKTGDHEYQLELPDGNRNSYKYEDGKIVEMISKRFTYQLKFVLVE